MNIEPKDNPFLVCACHGELFESAQKRANHEKRRKKPLAQDEQFRHFVRKTKPIRYKTKIQGNKEVDELLLMDELPDNIDNKISK